MSSELLWSGQSFHWNRRSVPWGGPNMARISGLPWPKAGHILEMAGKNKF
jgi:hypothetical protein